MKKIEHVIKSSQLISFDIFDTLLIRPYVRPIDLFFHMEKYYQIPGFAESRIQAELKAREKIHPDVTLTDIYNEIQEEYKSFKAKELAWEEMVLRPNPYGVKIWNLAKKTGKKIIILSDMYLPLSFIKNLLKKNGFDGYEKIYLSCDIKKTKHFGDMFDFVINDNGVKPNKILHIGDNKYSDYKVPKTFGIKTFVVDKYVEKYLKAHARVKKFLETQHNQIGASILVSLLAINAIKEKKSDYWTNLGYEYAGPIAYSYVKWINKVADEKKISDLLFVARDGYMLQQIHKQISNRSSHYVYAPRYLGLICQLSYRTDDSDVATAQQRTIIEHYAKTNKKFGKIVKNTDFNKISQLDFLQVNKNLLESLAHSNFENYKKYITNLHVKTNVGIIDTITENFTAQNLLTSSLGNKKHPYGFYFVTIHKHEIVKNSLWFSFVNSSRFSTPEWIAHWGLMEFLLTSPEYPIEGIDTHGKPIYKNNIDKYEQRIRSLYPLISSSANNFVKDLVSIFKGIDIYLDYDTIVNWINYFILHPTNRDIRNMFSIRTATNPNNDSYDGLFGQYISPLYAMFHPLKALYIAKRNLWKTKLQKFFIVCMSPIKIRMQGLKKIHVIFFQKLSKEYLCIRVLNFKIGLGENK